MSHFPDAPATIARPLSLGRVVGILFVLCLCLFFRELGSRALWASHEARAAQNAQRMLDDGTWLLPRLYDDQIELQKPPGYYWLVAIFGSLLGEVNGVAVRLPSALSGTALVLLLAGYLHKRGQPRAAFIAGVVLATSFHFTGTARIGRIDVPLALAVAVCVLVGRDGLTTWRRVLCVALGGTATLLLKGPVGLILPVAVLAVWWLHERMLGRNLLRGSIALGGAVALAAPWFIWVHLETEGEFTRSFFVYHHVQRAFGGADALAAHPWWYYVPRLAGDFLPWTPCLLLFRKRWLQSSDVRFGLVWLLVIVVGLSVSRFKRADYLIPAYAGFALLVGCGLADWYNARPVRTQRRLRGFFFAVCVSVPLGWWVFDRVVTDRIEATRVQAPFAATIRTLAPAPHKVLLFRVESHLLTFHLGRPVRTLVEWSELHDQCRRQICFVVVRQEGLAEFETHGPTGWSIIATQAGEPVAPQRPLLLLRVPPQEP